MADVEVPDLTQGINAHLRDVVNDVRRTMEFSLRNLTEPRDTGQLAAGMYVDVVHHIEVDDPVVQVWDIGNHVLGYPQILNDARTIRGRPNRHYQYVQRHVVDEWDQIVEQTRA